VVRPRYCRVIYYFDTPILGRRHQLFGRVKEHQDTQHWPLVGAWGEEHGKMNKKKHRIWLLEDPEQQNHHDYQEQDQVGWLFHVLQ